MENSSIKKRLQKIAKNQKIRKAFSNRPTGPNKAKYKKGTLSGNNVDCERIPVIHNAVGKEVFTGISVEFFTSEFPSMISG